MNIKTGIIFDLETTGLSANSKIIEFAGYKIDLNNFNIIDKLHIYINPQREIPRNIIELTGYNIQHIKNNPTFDNIKGQIINFFKNTFLIIGQNIQYDLGILYQHLKYQDLQIILKEFQKPIFDTMEEAKNIVKAKNSKNRLKNPTLKEIAKSFNIPIKDKDFHSALYDVEITYRVFKHIKRSE